MQHLFFKPTISPFRALSQNGFIVDSDEHRLISLDKDFLGVKTCIHYSNDPLAQCMFARKPLQRHNILFCTSPDVNIRRIQHPPQ